MATYDFVGRSIFSKADGSLFLYDPSDGSATDLQPDPSQPGATEFNIGEDIFVNGSASSLDFIGFYTDGSGNQFPVLEGASFYEILNVQFPSGTNYSSLTITASDFTVCFAAGTLIATPEGETTVETLVIGDMVLTADGRSVPVKWVGHQTTMTLFAGTRGLPVRISAGALGENVPHRDLVVTKDHGMPINGVICHAGALINGTTITEVPASELGQRETYYHIETECHEVILANGAEAETYIDNVGRSRFDNYAEFVDFYGSYVDDIPALEAPRAKGPRQVPQSVKDLIRQRAEILLGAHKRTA